MPRYIVKVGDLYGEWSTVVDAPVTHLGTREQFRDYYEKEYGRASMDGFEERMKRADEKGTSSLMDKSAEEVMSCNRFGKGEGRLSVPAVISKWKRETEDAARTARSMEAAEKGGK